MSTQTNDSIRQLTSDLEARIKAFHRELIEEFDLKGLHFRVGYGGVSGMERRQRVSDDGITHVSLKTRNLTLEFETTDGEQ